ncbi:hypothetical protein JHN63_11450 [Streptomyces sp. MBT65]|uniref:hypothetical protein n=1 Tax=Streptomyces sp. MBT65 TaxID=1488395 RepID=UPI00190E3730|nr:hypothetical protein [Streptomyces sp. MBT65]MBK3574423.1 hypothetical protein [Streptomyces sp. MBT65]
MFDWLDQFVRLADEVRPEKARHLVRLAFISTAAAILWAVAAGPVADGLTVWAPLLAFGLSAVVALVIAGLFVLSASGEIIDSVNQRPPSMPGGHHIACRVGRRRLECGLLHVTGPTTALPEADVIGPCVMRTWSASTHRHRTGASGTPRCTTFSAMPCAHSLSKPTSAISLSHQSALLYRAE